MQISINIAKDFTEYPGARYRSDGKFSGEEFYEDVLKPKMDEVWNTNNTLLLDFDGTHGYASSFISETFLRLVKDYTNKKQIKKNVKLKSDEEPLLINIVWKIVDEINLKCETKR